MGFGTLANRPTTCTTNSLEPGGGVGYFATDQGASGTLYRCSATNTWTVHYTPYAYPHPLVSGSSSGSSSSSGSAAAAQRHAHHRAARHYQPFDRQRHGRHTVQLRDYGKQ